MSLDRLRGEVAEVTRELLKLVAKRMELVKRIGEEKRRLGLDVDAPKAEVSLMRMAVKETRDLGLDEKLASRVLSLLIAESARVQRAKGPSVFLRARELSRERRIIRLEVGEPDFGPPQPVVEELCKAAREGYVKYSTASGIPELREAIAEHLGEKLGIDLKKEQVIVTPGGRMALYLAMATSLNLGSRVLMFEPYWPAYRNFTEQLGSKPVILRTELEDGWEPDLGELKDQDAELAVINYPNNPTGKIVGVKKFEGMLDHFRDTRIRVVSDEVYYDYTFGKEVRSILQYDVDGVVIGSFSKSFGMTGFRIGFAISSKDLVEKMVELQRLMLTNVPEFVQLSALKAFDLYPEEVRRNVAEVRGRMEGAERVLKSMPISYYRPDGGLYVFPRIDREGFESDSFSEWLLEEKGVAVAPGSMYGRFKEFIRISLCTSPKLIRDGLDTLRRALDEGWGSRSGQNGEMVR